MSSSTLSFERISKEHIPLLFSWLKAVHLKGLYESGCSSLAEMEAKYLSDEVVRRFIVLDKRIPFGYIQAYEIDAHHEYRKYAHPKGRTVGLDLLIGERDFLGKGLGLQMVEQFIALLEPEVERVIVDPQEGNLPAVALFQKYGFRKIGVYGKQSVLGIDLRKAVRGVILNPSGEVLLILYSKKKEDVSKFWLTPGGKVEHLESYEEALRREIREETGFTALEARKVLFADEWVEVEEPLSLRLFNRYYLVHTGEKLPSRHYLTEEEKELVLDYQWWPLEELLTTQELVYPLDLGKKLEKLLI